MIHVKSHLICKLCYMITKRDWSDGKDRAGAERSIKCSLNKMTDDKDLQIKIYEACRKGMYDNKDDSYRPVTRECLKIGVIIEWPPKEVR